ncbi:MAG: GspH/FimT family pseudopilin [Pseudomonadota bacterium]
MKTHRGFTLIELMITLAVAAILLTIGIPSFSDFVKNNRLVGYVNEFVAAAHLARSEAIKRRRYGYICASSNQSSCTGGTNWAVGWITWIDDNGDGTPQSSELLRVRQALDATVSYTSDGASSFRFDPMGISPTTGTLTMCDDRTGEQGRTIGVSNSGRVAINPTPFACS